MAPRNNNRLHYTEEKKVWRSYEKQMAMRNKLQVFYLQMKYDVYVDGLYVFGADKLYPIWKELNNELYMIKIGYDTFRSRRVVGKDGLVDYKLLSIDNQVIRIKERIRPYDNFKLEEQRRLSKKETKGMPAFKDGLIK